MWENCGGEYSRGFRLGQKLFNYESLSHLFAFVVRLLMGTAIFFGAHCHIRPINLVLEVSDKWWR